MKKTKRFLATIMALAAVSAIAPVSAFATDYDAEGNALTDVTWTSNAAYTVTIPATVALGNTATIEAENVNLNAGEQLNVTLSGTSDAENAFKLTTATDSLTYTVSKGDDNVAVGDVVLNVTAGTQTGSSILAFNEPATTPNAGDYTGTVTFTVSVQSSAPANPYAANSVGDVVTFGSYNWYIIGKSDNGVTLLMKENLTTKGYNDSYASVTWETCSLRTYLNGEFYNSFSAEDKAKIVKTSITNPNNPDYHTNGGNNTEDYIYLLSIDEAKALDDSIRNNGSWWWLRSPGSNSNDAAFVDEDGYVYADGYGVDYEGGVRPALNLKF